MTIDTAQVTGSAGAMEGYGVAVSWLRTGWNRHRPSRIGVLASGGALDAMANVHGFNGDARAAVLHPSNGGELARGEDYPIGLSVVVPLLLLGGPPVLAHDRHAHRPVPTYARTPSDGARQRAALSPGLLLHVRCASCQRLRADARSITNPRFQRRDNRWAGQVTCWTRPAQESISNCCALRRRRRRRQYRAAPSR